MKHACKRVSQLTSESFDRELSLAEKLQLKFHFTICGLCRSYHQSLTTMSSIFAHIREQDLKQDIHMPAEAKQRIQSVLAKEK